MSRPKLSQVLPSSVFAQLQVAQTKTRAIADILRSSEHIFYQSHMRAYTSLISHILASNPEIAGYLELHRSYRHPADLVVMRHQIQTISGAGVHRSRYHLDKLLHNGNGVSEEIASMNGSKSIFALRRPAETLPSIIEMVNLTGERMAYDNPEGATEYYLNRVQRLVHEADKAGDSFYFDAESVIDDTDRLLGRLTAFLGLESVLVGEYNTFAQTGEKGSGDPSENIKSGTIVRDRKTPTVDFPTELLAEADEAYQGARQELIQRCTITVTNQGAPS